MGDIKTAVAFLDRYASNLGDLTDTVVGEPISEPVLDAFGELLSPPQEYVQTTAAWFEPFDEAQKAAVKLRVPSRDALAAAFVRRVAYGTVLQPNGQRRLVDADEARPGLQVSERVMRAYRGSIALLHQDAALRILRSLDGDSRAALALGAMPGGVPSGLPDIVDQVLGYPVNIDKTANFGVTVGPDVVEVQQDFVFVKSDSRQALIRLETGLEEMPLHRLLISGDGSVVASARTNNVANVIRHFGARQEEPSRSAALLAIQVLDEVVTREIDSLGFASIRLENVCALLRLRQVIAAANS